MRDSPKFRSLVTLALRGTFRLSGRSRRSELAAYIVFQLILGGVLSQVAGLFIDRFQQDVFALAISVVLAVPTVALMGRRLHDFDVRAVWVIPVVALAMYNTAMSVVGLTQGTEARIAAERVLWPLDWVGIVIVLGALTIALAPGTRGANRFGPDSREAE